MTKEHYSWWQESPDVQRSDEEPLPDGVILAFHNVGREKELPVESQLRLSQILLEQAGIPPADPLPEQGE